MSKRKNHHFVPQFYFRRFSTDGRSICLLQRSTGKAIAQASIKAQSSKNWFYGTEEVEEALGEIESACSAALHAVTALRNPAHLDEENIRLLLSWLSLQRSRTEAARQASQPMHAKLPRLHLEVEINNNEDMPEEQKAELRKALDHVTSNPVPLQGIEMRISLEAAHLLADLAPTLLENRTNRPFIFGDAPVVYYNGFYRDVKLRGVLGKTTPGLMVFFPRSPTLCLMLFDPETYEVKRIQGGRIFIRDLSDVLAFNKLQLHAASSCVYFHDLKFAGYVQALWQQERTTLSAHRNTVVEEPGYDQNGKFIGDIVQAFQPQLPYRLKLSFLDHLVLGDAEYRHSRRGERAQRMSGVP